MKFSKIIAMILIAQMLATPFVSCAKNEIETNSTETFSAETKAPETAAPETEPIETRFDRTTVSDNLPEITFNGQDFRFVVNPSRLTDLVKEDYTGEAMNDTIYTRNAKVENRFDVKISAEASPVGGEWHSQRAVGALLEAGDYQYEICDMRSLQSIDLPGNYPGRGLYNWLEVPYVNFEQPWWNSKANLAGALNGKLWTVCSSLSVSSLTSMYTMYYNRELMKEFGYPPEEINRMVFDGEWTIDKMIEICSSIYRDENGNSSRDTGDIFGYNFGGSPYAPWLWAIEERALAVNEEGTSLVITLQTEKVHSTLEKLVNFVWATDGAIMTNDSISEFKNGNVAIVDTVLSNCFGSFGDLDFSVLPYPKYDKEQENYHTDLDPSYSVYGIPANIPVEYLDMVGVIMEALSAESWKHVWPAYYDAALKGRYSADADVAKLVDIVAEGCVYTYEWTYEIWMNNKIPQFFDWCIIENTTDLASKIAKSKPESKRVLPMITSFYYAEVDESGE